MKFEFDSVGNLLPIAETDEEERFIEKLIPEDEDDESFIDDKHKILCECEDDLLKVLQKYLPINLSLKFNTTEENEDRERFRDNLEHLFWEIREIIKAYVSMKSGY